MSILTDPWKTRVPESLFFWSGAERWATIRKFEFSFSRFLALSFSKMLRFSENAPLYFAPLKSCPVAPQIVNPEEELDRCRVYAEKKP